MTITAWSRSWMSPLAFSVLVATERAGYGRMSDGALAENVKRFRFAPLFTADIEAEIARRERLNRDE